MLQNRKTIQLEAEVIRKSLLDQILIRRKNASDTHVDNLFLYQNGDYL